MGDPFKKVKGGDPLDLSATAWNGFIDAALAHKQNQQNTGGPGRQPIPQAGAVLVRNDTDEDRRRFDVLYLRDMVFKPTDGNGNASEEQFLSEPVFTGTVQSRFPEPGDDRPRLPAVWHYGVLLEPIGKGEIGRAMINGIAPVKLEFTEEYIDEVGTRALSADPTRDLTTFSPWGSGAKVLWHEDVTGEGTYWALVQLGTKVLQYGGAPNMCAWGRITGPGTDDGIYYNWELIAMTTRDEWEVVELPDDIQLRRLVEANGFGGVPVDTVVQIVETTMLLPDEGQTETLPWGVFEYAIDSAVGYGIPYQGEVDNWTNSTSIELIKTDKDGNELTGDDAGTIHVRRNAAGTGGIFADYPDDAVLTYVRYPEPDGVIEGCLFGPTERFKVSQSVLPLGGRYLYGNEDSPVTMDVTGRDDQTEHVHVRGRMYYDDDHGWAPWVVFDPEHIPKTDSVVVKTNDTDTTAGYLDDEIVVDPGGEHWLTKSITPGGNADNKLLLEHKDWGENSTATHPTAVFFAPGLTGNGVSTSQSAPTGDDPWLAFKVFEEQYDDKGHSRLVDKGHHTYYSLPPSADEKVKASAGDPEAGYLDAKISSGNGWINVFGGGATVSISHDDMGSIADSNGFLMANLGGGGEGAVVSSQPPVNTPYVELDNYYAEWDAKGHGRVVDHGSKKYVGFVVDQVRANSSDPSMGYLSSKLTATPDDASPNPMELSVTAASQVCIEHSDLDTGAFDPADDVTDILQLISFGGGVTLDISTPPDGYGYIEYEPNRFQRDSKGHADMTPRQAPATSLYLKWPTVPEGTSGDMLYWSDGKWTLLPAPPTLSVLVSTGSTPRWEPVEEFICPGTT